MGSKSKRSGEVFMPLDDIRSDVDTVVYADDEVKDTMTLVWAVTHKIDPYNTLPRVLITAKKAEAGKTTWLNLSLYIAQNAWMSDPTPFAIRSKLMEPERTTALFQEISKIFGENGLRGRGSPIYKLLVESYQRNAKISFSVDRTYQEASSFCVAIMDGLGAAAPTDLRSRSIKIIMKPVPDSVELEDSLDQGVEAIFRAHHDRLHAWMTSFDTDLMAELARNYRHWHPKLRSRKAQIWVPLFVVAELAGGDWPERVRRAFVKLALEASEKPILSSEQQVIQEAGKLLMDHVGPYLRSAELLAHLRRIKEVDVFQKLSDYQMARLMTKALGKADTLTLPGHKTAKGWHTTLVLALAQELEEMLAPEPDDLPESEWDTFFAEDVETTETTETTV